MRVYQMRRCSTLCFLLAEGGVVLFFHLSPVHSSDNSVFMSARVLQKVMRRSQHARKETEFLRLKRTRLGLDDFESLKVIGRGAFGEVRHKKKHTRLRPF